MRIEDQQESENVEDRRGMSRGTVIGGGLGAVVLAIVITLMGGDPGDILNQAQNGAGQATEDTVPDSPEARAGKQFVSRVLKTTEDVWARVLPDQTGMAYRNPKLVLFSGGVDSACGQASASTGPFYCPGDEKVYIDLSFYDELRSRFQAPGDFAQAYVIAHEIGHHVQKILGKSEEVNRQHGRVSERDYNRLSVRLELQADFYAGVWAFHAQKALNILEEGDIEEALTAANAIGDDRLQKQSQGRVVPDSFTHGTSQQRIRWFTKGFKTGDMKQGDTFTISYESL